MQQVDKVRKRHGRGIITKSVLNTKYFVIYTSQIPNILTIHCEAWETQNQPSSHMEGRDIVIDLFGARAEVQAFTLPTGILLKCLS